MTDRANAWFERKYVAGATHILQHEGWATKGMGMEQSSIKGNEIYWRLAGTGTATVMQPGVVRRPTMNADRTYVSATMVDYEANEWIAFTDLKKMSENEIQIAAQAGGYAMGRNFDKQFVAAMDAASLSGTMIGDGSTALSPNDLINAQAAILGAGVNGPMDLITLLPYSVMKYLLSYREFVNCQFVGDDYPLLQKIGARMWMGMMIVPLPDSTFATPSGTQKDSYMFLKSCMGRATNYEMDSRVDYVPTEKAYFAANTMGFAVAALQTAGIRRLRFDGGAAMSRPNP